MNCLHPFCPMKFGTYSGDWSDVVVEHGLQIKPKDQAAVAGYMNQNFSALGSVPPGSPLSGSPLSKALLKRLLDHCPCLFAQLDVSPTARAVVHLCEISLGKRIDASNVHDAFLVQDPRAKGITWMYPPVGKVGSIGGQIMEMLCSEVLASAGIPAMEIDGVRWPVWQMPGHVLLNEGKMSALKSFGDILIPCAPTNLVVSVKSAAARERLLYSSNAIEGVGFGFFDQPEEFWTTSRMTLYKRMGFSAIYMPDTTHAAVMERISGEGRDKHAVNVNGTALYRPLSSFGDDMLKVVGKSTLNL